MSGCNDNPADDPQLIERPLLSIGIKVGKTRFTLIGNHLASQGHPEACRQAQADFLNDQVRELEAAGGSVTVIGDMNAYQDSPSLAEDLPAGTSLRDLLVEGAGRRPLLVPVRRPARDPRPHLRHQEAGEAGRGLD